MANSLKRPRSTLQARTGAAVKLMKQTSENIHDQKAKRHNGAYGTEIVHALFQNRKLTFFLTRKQAFTQ
jgi:hypothetical protein